MENASNNNWLTLLRRKIQKKFKRNRQKATNIEELTQPESEEVDDNQNIDEIPTGELSIQEVGADESNSSSHNCEEMKKQLFKLNWYWPNLR